jgi:hypothetical protein
MRGLGLRITTAHLSFAGDFKQQIVHPLIEIVFGAIQDFHLMLAGRKEGRLIARKHVPLDILEGTTLCTHATVRVFNPQAQHNDTDTSIAAHVTHHCRYRQPSVQQASTYRRVYRTSYPRPVRHALIARS